MDPDKTKPFAEKIDQAKTASIVLKRRPFYVDPCHLPKPESWLFGALPLR